MRTAAHPHPVLTLLARASLLLACLGPHPAVAGLVHRWSFNDAPGTAGDGTTMPDSVSGTVATVRGEYVTAASFDGSALRLPGTSNGNHSLGFMSPYVDLPNGIISSKTHLSVEIWATPYSTTGYDRLFDFGRSDQGYGPGAAPGELVDVNGQGQTPGNRNADDSIHYALSVGANEDAQRMHAMINDTSDPGLYHDAAQPTSFGTRYHYVFTFEDGVGAFGASGGRVSWYRDGSLIHSSDVSFRLSEVEDVNNWLGRSQWTQDWNADVAYDEVRIYDHALTPTEIASNLTAGPDSLEDLDTDDDGLLDLAFEDHYFGDDDGTATEEELGLQDGSGNPDGDAFTNLQEQQLGSDPTDSLSPPPPPAPDHLWTFTTQADSSAESGTVFVDEIGGSWTATLIGRNGALDGKAVILPGSTNGNQPASTLSAYLDLSNGIISASPNLSIEAWATPLSSKNWQRLFDFGRCVETSGPGALTGEIVDGAGAPGNTGAWDNLSLTLNNGNDLDTQQLEGEFDDNGPVFTTSSAATTAGVEYHYVLIVEDGVGEFGANGCRVSWYRDAVLQNTDDFNFRLVDMEDVNNWIGRSMYAADSNSNLSLNELRIHRRAISPAEVFSSYTAGPDPSTGPPEPPAPQPIPVRLWDFNTPGPVNANEGTLLVDAATGEEAVVHGVDAELTGTHLLLPGTSNGQQPAGSIAGYLELPNGFVSSFESMTFEGWITPHSSENWQRIWDFGNCTATHGPGALPGEIVDNDSSPGGFQASDNLFLSLNNGGDLGSHRLGGKLNGGGETQDDTDLSSVTDVDTEYHVVMTVQDLGTSGCEVRWYRDGILRGTVNLPFRLADLDDVNNWIGRSNWSGDSNSHLSINELRVYDRAITQQEINTSHDNGADHVFPAPVAVDDQATIHAGQKVLVDVLANDSGGPLADTLEVVTPPAAGTATLTEGGILFAHDGGPDDELSCTYRAAGIGGTSNTATVTISVTDQLRIPDTEFNVPASAPPTAIAVVDAFPGLTFNQPVGLTPIPGDSQRLLVCEIGGVLKVIPDVTSPTPTSATVLDLPAAIASRVPAESIQGWSNNECGLLSAAVHPDFENNGHLFLCYTVNVAGTYYERVSRFTVPPEQVNSPTPAADPNSEVVLIDQLDQGSNHQGGDMHFGPDGYLYVAFGDELNPNDTLLNSQRIDKDLYAAMMRIDVDKLPGNLEPNPHAAVPTDGGGDAHYSIPADNPWIGATEFLGQPVDPAQVRTEFWAVGLRSPWRFSFDPVTGELWLGDVGQDRYEEVDIITAGANYGWVFLEGTHDINANNGGWPARPVYEYVHNAMTGDPLYKGNSVTGGVVYRGARIPELVGAYVFGDQVSGHIWSLVRNDGAAPTVTRIAGLPSVSSFGVDPSNGDVLMTATPANRPNSNTYTISRLVTQTPSGSFPATLTETGLFSDLSDLSPAPGLLPYGPAVRFWSDHGIKRRWFAIPDSAKRMTWTREGAWDYPDGQIWVKHFDLELERGNPSTKKRLETRLLVKNDSGAYGVSYRWNDEETEAFLVEDGGVGFPVDLLVGGVPTVQMWQIPSRAQCMICHNPAAGHALSFNTRQLNRDDTIHGFSGNQIELLHLAGYLDNTPDPVDTLPAHAALDDASAPLEERVRTYLDVNCAYCHQPGGGGPGWDGRAALSLEQTGMIHGSVAAAENPGDELVVPGDPLHSVMLSRIAETNGYTRMPPLATAELDQEAIALLTDWIQGELPGHVLYDDWAAGYPGLGGPDDDDDGDGRTNREEHLLGSNPLSGDEPAPAAIVGGSFEFERQPFRIYDIQTSVNLVDWDRWDVPENVGTYDTTKSPVSIPIPLTGDETRFFRMQVTEP